MARNGSGTYSLPAGNPVVTATTIASSWANTTLTDVANALTQSLSKDGQTAMTGNLVMGGNSITGLSSLTMSGTLSVGGTLGVTGNSTFSGTLQETLSNPTLTLTDSGANGAFLQLGATNAAGYFINASYSTTSAGALNLQTANVTRLSIANTGAVSVAAPTSGTVALTATGASANQTAIFQGASVSGSSIGVSIFAGYTAADYPFYVANRTQSYGIMQLFGDGHGYLGYNGSAQTLSWTAAGAVSIAAPSSNTTALAITGYSGGQIAQFTGASSPYFQITDNTYYGLAQVLSASAAMFWGSNGASTAAWFGVNGFGNIKVATNGAVSIANASSSAQTLSVAGAAATPTVALSAGGAIALDASKGNVFTASVTSNATVTISNMFSGQTINLRTTTTGAYTVTFSPTPKWQGGTAGVATSSGTDLWVITYDGTSYYASQLAALA